MFARFLDRDAVENTLVDMASPGVSGGISDAERSSRIAGLSAEIARVKVSEEATIRALEDRSEFIERRADVRPDIALAARLDRLEVN